MIKEECSIKNRKDEYKNGANLRDSCEVHGGLTGSPGQLSGGWRVGSRGPSRCERKSEAVQLLIRPTTNPLVTVPSSPSLLELLFILFLVLSQITFRHAPPSPHNTLLRRCHPPLKQSSLGSKAVCSHFPTLPFLHSVTTSNSCGRLFTGSLCHFKPLEALACLSRLSHGPQPRVAVSPGARRLHYPVPRVSSHLPPHLPPASASYLAPAFGLCILNWHTDDKIVIIWITIGTEH